MKIRELVVVAAMRKDYARGANAITRVSRTAAPLSVLRIKPAIAVNATAGAVSSKSTDDIPGTVRGYATLPFEVIPGGSV